MMYRKDWHDLLTAFMQERAAATLEEAAAAAGCSERTLRRAAPQLGFVVEDGRVRPAGLPG